MYSLISKTERPACHYVPTSTAMPSSVELCLSNLGYTILRACWCSKTSKEKLSVFVGVQYKATQATHCMYDH